MHTCIHTNIHSDWSNLIQLNPTITDVKKLTNFICYGRFLLWPMQGLQFSIHYWRISVTPGAAIAGFNCIRNGNDQVRTSSMTVFEKKTCSQKAGSNFFDVDIQTLSHFRIRSRQNSRGSIVNARCWLSTLGIARARESFDSFESNLSQTCLDE